MKAKTENLIIVVWGIITGALLIFSVCIQNQLVEGCAFSQLIFVVGLDRLYRERWTRTLEADTGRLAIFVGIIGLFQSISSMIAVGKGWTLNTNVIAGDTTGAVIIAFGVYCCKASWIRSNKTHTLRCREPVKAKIIAMEPLPKPDEQRTFYAPTFSYTLNEQVHTHTSPIFFAMDTQQAKDYIGKESVVFTNPDNPKEYRLPELNAEPTMAERVVRTSGLVCIMLGASVITLVQTMS